MEKLIPAPIDGSHPAASSYVFARDSNQSMIHGSSHSTTNYAPNFTFHVTHADPTALLAPLRKTNVKSTASWISRALARNRRNSPPSRSSQPRAAPEESAFSAGSSTPTAPPGPSVPTPRPASRSCGSSNSSVSSLKSAVSVTSLSSLESLPKTRPSTGPPSCLQVYIDSMFAKAQGYPCFNPRPRPDAPLRPGDVGTMSTDGFKPVFNVYNPPAEFSEYCKVPDAPTASPPTEVFQEGDVLSEGISSADTICSADRESVLGYRFQCPSPKGALLAVTSDSADLEELDNNATLCDYLCENAVKIYRYVRSRRYLEPGESLYVVTGSIKASGWALAAHKDPMFSESNYITVENNGPAYTPHPDLAKPVTWRWTQKGNAETRQGQSKLRDEAGRLVKDQCLFLRGFLITPSPEFRSRLDGHWGDDDPDSWPDSLDQEHPDEEEGEGTGQKRMRRGFFGKGWRSNQGGGSGSSSLGSSGMEEAEDFVVESYPPRGRVNSSYPLQAINEELLENTNADFAISHDYCWINSMSDSQPSADALRKAVSRVAFVNSTGCIRSHVQNLDHHSRPNAAPDANTTSVRLCGQHNTEYFSTQGQHSSTSRTDAVDSAALTNLLDDPTEERSTSTSSRTSVDIGLPNEWVRPTRSTPKRRHTSYRRRRRREEGPLPYMLPCLYSLEEPAGTAHSSPLTTSERDVSSSAPSFCDVPPSLVLLCEMKEERLTFRKIYEAAYWSCLADLTPAKHFEPVRLTDFGLSYSASPAIAWAEALVLLSSSQPHLKTSNDHDPFKDTRHTQWPPNPEGLQRQRAPWLDISVHGLAGHYALIDAMSDTMRRRSKSAFDHPSPNDCMHSSNGSPHPTRPRPSPAPFAQHPRRRQPPSKCTDNEHDVHLVTMSSEGLSANEPEPDPGHPSIGSVLDEDSSNMRHRPRSTLETEVGRHSFRALEESSSNRNGGSMNLGFRRKGVNQ